VHAIRAAAQQVLKDADLEVTTGKMVRQQVAALTKLPYADPLLKSTVKAVIAAYMAGKKAAAQLHTFWWPHAGSGAVWHCVKDNGSWHSCLAHYMKADGMFIKVIYAVLQNKTAVQQSVLSARLNVCLLASNTSRFLSACLCGCLSLCPFPCLFARGTVCRCSQWGDGCWRGLGC